MWNFKGTILSVFGIEPFRIGGQESFARELSLQAGQRGWRTIHCFACPPAEKVRRYLETPNVALEVLKHPEQTSWETLAGYDQLLRRYRPDVVHLHFTPFVGPYPWLARLRSVKRIFFTDHQSRPDSYAFQQAPYWKRRLVRLINWPLTRVICPSPYGYECMIHLDLLPPDRFTVIENAVDFSRLGEAQNNAARFLQKHSIPDDRFIVLQISWIIPEKGIQDFLEAARLVLLRNLRVQFVLVGEGPYREEYARLSVQMGLEKNVTWTGLVEDPIGEGVYAAADVVCQVSRWQELVGYTVLEAMASGKAVIGTRVGGIPYVIEDGKSGFLVPRGDAQQIAEKILQLLKDDALRERMGMAARQFAEARFDVRRNVTQLLQVYNLWGTSPPRSPVLEGGHSSGTLAPTLKRE